MNFIQGDKSKGRKVTRGRGRRRFGNLEIQQQVLSVQPKYLIAAPRQSLAPSTPRYPNTTPRARGRGYGTTSSCSRRSSIYARTTDSAVNKTTSPGTTSDIHEAFVIMAITTGRGDARGEVGLAVMDVEYPHMVLCQLSDYNSYVNTLTKIYRFNPAEILMPDTICNDSNNLYSAIQNRFKNITITGIPRIHFNDIAGLDRIRTHCAKEFSSVELIVHRKYYALASASALMKYIEYIQHVQYLPKTMRVEYQVGQDTAMIDIESAQSLELVTTNGGQSNYCLLGAIDRCSTPPGRRLLRASILQPSCDVNVIHGRQRCVEELIQNRSLYNIIQPVLRRFSGVNRLLSLAMHKTQNSSIQSAEKHLNYILLLKHTVDLIPELRATLNTVTATFFKKVRTDLEDESFNFIKEKILSIIHPEAKSVQGFTSANMQRCFAIKSRVNDMLDVSRQTYCELIDAMQSMVAKLGEKYTLPLSLGCNMSLGYHIQMNIKRNSDFQPEDLPKDFIQVQKKRNVVFMTTEPLVVLSQHCKDACDELHDLSDSLLRSTLNEIREYVSCLFLLSDNIAELDLIMSLATISSISDYVKPTFGPKLEVISSKHPVMDILGSDSPTPNDVVASVPYNFHTITGPNMSGKTIYLKQIVLLHIMAQIGCYVPATKAQFRITDNMFCRLGVRDDIEYDASTFMLEIKEVQYILQSITPISLVVLDELCRSTTVEEGSSIAWTICKKLSISSAFTFHTTHFQYLLMMPELYPNITNLYMETLPNEIDEQNRLIYTYHLKKGVSSVEHYGMALAKVTGFPTDTFEMAEEILAELTQSLKPTDVKGECQGKRLEVSERKMNYDYLVAIYEELEKEQVDTRMIFNHLKKLKVSNDNELNAPLLTTVTLLEPTVGKTITNDIEVSGDSNQNKLVKRLSSVQLESEPPAKMSKLSSPQVQTIISESQKQPLKMVHEHISQSNIRSRNLAEKMPENLIQKSKEILLNPTTNPNSPLFIPRSENTSTSSFYRRNLPPNIPERLMQTSKEILQNPTTNPESPLFVPRSEIISQSDFYRKFFPNNVSENFIRKSDDILKNQASIPEESPLFIPAKETFLMPGRKAPRPSSQSDKKLKVASQNSQEAIQSRDKLSTVKRITSREPSTTSSTMDVFAKLDLTSHRAPNYIPEQYSHMKHILNKIVTGAKPNASDVTKKNTNATNTLFFSSDVVSRPPRVSEKVSKLSSEDVRTSDENNITSPALSLTDCSVSKVPSGLSTKTAFMFTPMSYISEPNNDGSIAWRSADSCASIDTTTAREEARRKEAEIFKEIEGSTEFDERQFVSTMSSMKSHITLSSFEVSDD